MVPGRQRPGKALQRIAQIQQATGDKRREQRTHSFFAIPHSLPYCGFFGAFGSAGACCG